MNGVELRAWLKRSPEEIVAGHPQSRGYPGTSSRRPTRPSRKPRGQPRTAHVLRPRIGCPSSSLRSSRSIGSRAMSLFSKDGTPTGNAVPLNEVSRLDRLGYLDAGRLRLVVRRDNAAVVRRQDGLLAGDEEVISVGRSAGAHGRLRTTRATILQMWASLPSDESRALMFIALDNLHNQGLRLAIVVVPENPSALASTSSH